MRLLIAIKSCRQDLERGCHRAIMDTWGKDAIALGIDVVFFTGDWTPAKPLEPGEVILACKDGYDDLPFKTREICRWAVAHSYDFVFLADTDTFIIPERLLKSGFEAYDYYGVIRLEPGKTFPYDAIDRQGKHWPIAKCYPWASGGIGYFLSGTAVRLVSETEPDHWAEDLWVGQVMGCSGLKVGDARSFNLFVAWHFPQMLYGESYDPEIGWMQDLYKNIPPRVDYCNYPYTGLRMRVKDVATDRYQNLPPMVAKRRIDKGRAVPV